MNYSISADRLRLTLMVDESERTELRELGDEIHTDKAMYEFFEHLVCNSELNWIAPEWTGDLTDAPMLGIAEWSDLTPNVAERWAWMPYAVNSLLEKLRDKGEAVLIGGPTR